MNVLVVNCGSSSIKYHLVDLPDNIVLAKGLIERIGEPESTIIHDSTRGSLKRLASVPDHASGMQFLLDVLAKGEARAINDIREIEAVGHRVVHGGEEFSESIIISDEVEAAIERYSDLAPLHNPPNLIGIRAARAELKHAVHVACFDTAFHATIPQVAYTYALPYQLYEQYGIRRYGFHGTSHRYVARRAAEMLGIGPHEINCITCHLGNGCSAAAVRGGRSIDTSMGLTPLEGLVMGTRSGDFDPAIIFYLVDKGYDVAALNKLCNKQSGLLGLSGVSNDIRLLLELARQGNARARLALDVFAYRAKKYIGAYFAVLGRVDCLVLTGGIGQNSPELRQAICAGLEQLGICLDNELNANVSRSDSEIQAKNSPVKILVVATDEEAAIAADAFLIATGRQVR